MGSPDNEPWRNSDEGPQHMVTLSGFLMSEYEITQGMYETVMGKNPSKFKKLVAGESGTPNKLPVDSVNWFDILVFCNKLSMMEGLTPAYRIPAFNNSTDPADWGTVPTKNDQSIMAWETVEMVSGSNGYRLPTEAQWEYACRAGTNTLWYNGNDEKKLDDIAWFLDNSNKQTHKVGLKAPNAWGLYDMIGNVFEWCWDWYGSKCYTSAAVFEPTGIEPSAYGKEKVLRGGTFGSTDKYTRSAYRSHNYVPGYTEIGFRVVRP